ncbi:hypothetical protein PISMIDRAFT_31021 [Pisolithus microcarpus 441]|uniref:Uncharacterized protein n=1 Tax=Pisolithus microcarpus 441 TaxID=765257 RepID=A0A0C9YP70_9AGAM|nr:hypothetical protein PISMIDRAFT_31021 [Pisolithus microcarpus 441]
MGMGMPLAVGVWAFDVLESALFTLRAYLILGSSDIPAMSLVMQMKGHNGHAPCCMCEIVGVRIPGGHNPCHYMPLDCNKLPLHQHDQMLSQAHEVQSAPNQTSAEQLALKYGIKGVPLLSYLPSMQFPASFPYEFMHLIWENVMKNLVLLWKGEFKGLDTGQESYELGKNTIPSTYGASPPNVTTDRMACTADTWSFWTLYIGPVVLRHKFTKEKYYKHFIDLVKILHVCLQFELSADDIQTVCRWLERWVLSYEEMYYQHDPCRINTCPVTIHALLHVADSIEATGPVWTSWSFPIEHFCGQLQPVIRS